MKNLRPILGIHRQQKSIPLNFACDRALISVVKSEKGGPQKRIYPPKLPHSFTTHGLEKGTDVRYLQALLEHKNSNTTAIYKRLSQRSLANNQSPLDRLMTI